MCVAQYLTARFLPYNHMKELCIFGCFSIRKPHSILFSAFAIADEIFPYSFFSLFIFLLLSYHLTFIPDIFKFCFLDKIPNNLFSGCCLFFPPTLSILFSLICAMKHSHSSYILLRTDTLSYELP